MITRDKENILAVIGLAIFSMLFWVLMCLFPSNAQTPADNFLSTFQTRPSQPAIEELIGEWHSVVCPKCSVKCWQYYGDGPLYDDIGTTLHYCNQTPVGEVEPLVIFAVLVWLLIGIKSMFNLYKKDNGRFRSSET